MPGCAGIRHLQISCSCVSLIIIFGILIQMRNWRVFIPGLRIDFFWKVHILSSKIGGKNNFQHKLNSQLFSALELNTFLFAKMVF